MDPILLFNFLGSAASIASLLVSLGSKEVTTETIEKLRERIPKKYWNDLISQEGAALISLLIIDKDLFNFLIHNIKSTQIEYRRCLNRARTPVARDACDQQATRKICEILNRIKDRNNDKLPTDYLQNIWASYRCMRY